MKKTYIYFPFIKEGYHCFPEAKTNKKYKTNDEMDVSHLGERHFHYFYFKVWIEVNHLNRDIEFIQCRRMVEKFYDSKQLELNNKSCEMIANDLLEKIKTIYKNVDIKVDVSEDNINGAIVEYTKEY